LLWGAGNFGLGGGLLPWGQANGGNGDGSGNGGYAAQDNQPQETPPPTDTSDTPSESAIGDESAPELIIKVIRDMVYHAEHQITIDELVLLLEELNYPEAVWELHDDQAIVETYEIVIALMRENGIEFIER